KKPADGDRTDFVAQYLACKAYVDRFPDSKYRNEVDNMMKAVAADYANILKKQAAVCDKQGKWDDCIAGLDQYLTHLSDTPEAEQIRKLHAGMVDQKELFDLDAKAAAISHDWAKALKLYTDYRDKRPDTTQLAALNKRINRLDVQAQDLAKWKDISAYASKPTHLITERVKRLEDYIKGAPEPYATQARQLRAKLEPALQQYRRDQKQAERDAAARQQQLAYEAFLAREKQRIARLQETASRKLKPVASRFRDNGNGTVTDLRTGLTWTLLDSTMEMEKGGYMDHRSAQAYVAILSTGGYSWRLPTASELATLYKNKPFFPETGAGWYWTSETFAKGFSYVVDVITTKPETVFYRIPKDEKELGAVRAVRR
ncbi:DUF1566 domain-containing protein, partial [Desulfosarcina sp. OttesenSCG-928-G10]|nr:DUF1566 domain-containing protein [Desulfosarcina sp. OttesenSCG-928-G10]